METNDKRKETSLTLVAWFVHLDRQRKRSPQMMKQYGLNKSGFVLIQHEDARIQWTFRYGSRWCKSFTFAGTIYERFGTDVLDTSLHHYHRFKGKMKQSEWLVVTQHLSEQYCSFFFSLNLSTLCLSLCKQNKTKLIQDSRFQDLPITKLSQPKSQVQVETKELTFRPMIWRRAPL